MDDQSLRLLRRGGRRGRAGQSHWAARAPYRPHDALRPDAGAAGRRAGRRTPTRSPRWSGSRPSPGSTSVERGGRQVWLRLADEWVERTGRRARARARGAAGYGDLAAGPPLRAQLLGRQLDQGAAHRPPAQPGARQRARLGAGRGRRQGRAAQHHLRRRPQHGRGDGGRRAQRPLPQGSPRQRRQERPLRRRLLRRVRQDRPPR